MTPAEVLAVGDLVLWPGCPWGVAKGKVLRTDGEPGRVLVQDLHPHGAREWWPVDGLALLPPDPELDDEEVKHG